MGLCAYNLRKLANFSTHSHNFLFYLPQRKFVRHRNKQFCGSTAPKTPTALVHERERGVARKSYELTAKCENKCALRTAVVVATKNKVQKYYTAIYMFIVLLREVPDSRNLRNLLPWYAIINKLRLTEGFV